MDFTGSTPFISQVELSFHTILDVLQKHTVYLVAEHSPVYFHEHVTTSLDNHRKPTANLRFLTIGQQA